MHLGSTFYDETELRSLPFRHLGSNVKIKRTAGLFFVENISIMDDARIDDFTIIVASREHVEIGCNVHIASQCYISGSDGFVMEDFSGLAPGVKIYTSSDDYTGERMTNPTLPRHLIGGPAGKVVLRKHVIIGSNSVVLPKVTIEEGSSVGSLSLVNKSLPAWGVYAGIPVRRLRDRSQNLLILEKELRASQA
ncbi:acyltransferase [Rhizobium leguminosarum]|uniref:acyltransferase n=1 Tax=Rhizobium leguminosarum TaxID=384 RepID=UPI001C921BAB|nr:acyltransferase [Rhizobium leguminosarum]MBY2920104.1 acyltransferase [Rhizobium leguminosarum]MBY2965650.1 acyltransferase [Rhizobium leguminosarum]MBY2985004.1 acyltransferase [Rhizobium leguminosarum]MBY3022977.1 acyltransferase [Rhizobium leguminosarum]